MISLKDKKNSEQIFSEVTIQQLDLSEKLFLYARRSKSNSIELNRTQSVD